MSDIAFGAYHPTVNFLYFAFVILFGMFFINPICLIIAFVCSFFYSCLLNGKKALRFNLLYMLPMMVLLAVLNPLFNHQGVTIIRYFANGNPLTLESIVYGIVAAVMVATIVSWFSCYNAVMSSDKFIYIFGRIIPALSLIFSMALRFVPKFKEQMQVISYAQKCIGRDISNGNIWERMRHGLRIVSIMVTWALENSIDTADSMKSRGYGLRGRTAFSLFRFEKRDKLVLTALIVCGGYIIFGAFTGGLGFSYFPSIQTITCTVFEMSLYVVYAVLCALPIMITLQEDRKWKHIQSKT